MIYKTWYVVVTLIFFTLAPHQARSEEPLTLEEAVQIAIAARDPSVERFEARAEAAGELAVADSQLPDPQLNLGFLNWPVDSFRYQQEAMTRVQFGLKQAIPPGKTLSLNRKRREAEQEIEWAMLDLRESQIALDTRLAWLELYYWLGAKEKVTASRDAVGELVEVATSVFATGGRTSQDVLRAELELSILDDRLVEVTRRIEMTRAELARLIGPEAAHRALPQAVSGEDAVALPMPAADQLLRERLPQHLSVIVEDARIQVRDHDIDIARQQYKPGWSVNVGYGLRGGGRSDFASVGVALEIPFFTGKRQDRRVSAAKRQRQVVQLDRDALLLELNKNLERTLADWRRQGERITLYQEAVTVRAVGTTEAALAAYRNGVSDFAELIRSSLAELDVELVLLRLIVDRARAQARLLYLEGGNNE